MKLNPSNNKEHLWNRFDEFALLVGLERKQNESNISLHNRIVNNIRGDSTKHGLVGWLNNIFDVPEGVETEVFEKRVFFSRGQPLSFTRYKGMPRPGVDYMYPIVKDYSGPGETVHFTYSGDTEIEDFGGYDYLYQTYPEYDEEKYWVLYKNVDGTYSNIWVASYPVLDVDLEYQTVIDDEVYNVLESPTFERGAQ